PRHLRQRRHEVGLDGADVGLDLLERAGRLIAVEVAVEVDLVADEADASVLRVPLRGVDPGVWHVRPNLAVEESSNARRNALRVGGIVAIGERYALGIPQLGIGLGVAVLVATDCGGLVALGEGRHDCLLDGCRKFQVGLAGCIAEYEYALFPVLEERIRQVAQEGADGVLELPSLGALLLTGGALLLGLSEILESLLVVESCNPFGRRLEVQSQRPLYRDLAEAEVRGREDAAHDHLFFLPVLHDPARFTVPEVGEDLQDVLRTLRRNLPALIAEALAHR